MLERASHFAARRRRQSVSRAAYLLSSVVLALVPVACKVGTSSKSAHPEPSNEAVEAAHDVSLRPTSRSLGGSIALGDLDGRRVAIVADETAGAIVVVDRSSNQPVSSTPIGGTPGQILIASNGVLFVAVRDGARVAAYRFRQGAKPYEIARHDTGDEPYGLAVTPDGSRLLVSSIMDSRLEVFRTSDLSTMFMTRVSRDPRSIVVTDDGKRAFVSHAAGSAVSVFDLDDAVGHESRTIRLDMRERRRDFGQSFAGKMPMRVARKLEVERPVANVTMPRTSNQGFALASIGGNLYLPETLVMTSDNQSIPSGYGAIEQSTLGTHVPFVARVDLASEKLMTTQFSGPDDRHCFESRSECILPRATVADGKKLYTACLDADVVDVLDTESAYEHAPVCRQRTRIPVQAPTGLAIDPERRELVAYSASARRLRVISLDDTAKFTDVELAPILDETVSASIAEGRALFHRSGDKRIAANGRSCASCHVDGREDGLVWPTPKGKRQTPMLAGRLDGTAPYGWHGEHASLVIHVRDTLKNLEGTGLHEDELEALAGYVATIRAPTKRSRTSDVVARGHDVFHSNETGCSSCHIEATRFADGETHVLVKGRPFDTPSLAFVGQTAPYFHDGRYGSLEQLIDECDSTMGKTKQLSASDRSALVAYLRTL